MTPTIGRSHGIHAEPTTFGVKLAGFYAEFARAAPAAGDGARRNRHLRHFRRGRHLRQYRSRGGRTCRREAGPRRRAGLDPGDPARPSRRLFRGAGRGGVVDRAAGDRNPPPAAHRSAGSRGVFLAGPEGLLRHAAQAQSGADRKPDRAWRAWCAAYAMPAMENVALWHERDISHSSVERYIGPDATITLDFALAPPGRRDREAGGLSGAHAGEPRPHPVAWSTASACCWR